LDDGMSGDPEWAEKLIRRARELAARNAIVTRHVTPPLVVTRFLTGEASPVTRDAPLSAAERARRYRERKRQSF